MSRKPREIAESYLHPRKRRSKRTIIRRSNGQRVSLSPEQTKLFTLKFLVELEHKAINGVIQAFRYRDEKGKRFPHDVMADPMFNLAGYLYLQEQREARLRQNVPIELLASLALCPQDDETTKLIQKLKVQAELQPEKFNARERLFYLLMFQLQNGPLPIQYFVAQVAIEFLRNHILPYKQEVRLEALKRWATFGGASPVQKRLKSKQTRWKTIYKTLGLPSLPPAPTSPNPIHSKNRSS